MDNLLREELEAMRVEREAMKAELELMRRERAALLDKNERMENRVQFLEKEVLKLLSHNDHNDVHHNQHNQNDINSHHNDVHHNQNDIDSRHSDVHHNQKDIDSHSNDDSHHNDVLSQQNQNESAVNSENVILLDAKGYHVGDKSGHSAVVNCKALIVGNTNERYHLGKQSGNSSVVKASEKGRKQQSNEEERIAQRSKVWPSHFDTSNSHVDQSLCDTNDFSELLSDSQKPISVPCSSCSESTTRVSKSAFPALKNSPILVKKGRCKRKRQKDEDQNEALIYRPKIKDSRSVSPFSNNKLQKSKAFHAKCGTSNQNCTTRSNSSQSKADNDCSNSQSNQSNADSGCSNSGFTRIGLGRKAKKARLESSYCNDMLASDENFVDDDVGDDFGSDADDEVERLNVKFDVPDSSLPKEKATSAVKVKKKKVTGVKVKKPKAKVNQIYPCSECQEVFPRLSSLARHTAVHGNGGKPFKCPECSSTFSSAGNLTVHLKKHQGIRPYSCNQCQATFAQASDLRSHARKHSSERPFTCKVCYAAFSRAGDLTPHMRIHTERPQGGETNLMVDYRSLRIVTRQTKPSGATASTRGTSVPAFHNAATAGADTH